MNTHIHNSARRPLRAALAVLTSVVALVLGGCGDSGPTGRAAGDGRLSIVATTTILADVVGEVAGEAAEVTAVMEEGADPHNFEASAQQLAQIQQADLIVANGGNLEEQLLDPVAEAERAGVPVLHATDHIDALALTGGRDDADDDHGAAGDHADEEGSVDPHFWMDPTRMADVARALGEQIAELSADADTIQAQADDYAARLEQLDRDITETLAAIPDDARTLVTNHEAFNYLADRYDFTIVGTVIPSLTTGAEPSAQDLEALASTVEQYDVTAVFAENTAPDQFTQALAAEVGAEVEVVQLYSDSLGGEGSVAATYVDMLTANADLIRQALAPG